MSGETAVRSRSSTWGLRGRPLELTRQAGGHWFEPSTAHEERPGNGPFSLHQWMRGGPRCVSVMSVTSPRALQPGPFDPGDQVFPVHRFVELVCNARPAIAGASWTSLSFVR